MSMQRSHDYEASAVMADTPLSSEEVEDILNRNGKGFVKDSRKVLHFVRRVEITIRAYRQQIRQLQYDIAEERSNRSRVGQATTLSPMDAFRFLSEEQQEKLFDAHFQEKLHALESLRTAAETAKAGLENERNRVRFAVSTLMEDPDVPAAVRERLRDLLAGAVSGNDPSVPPSPRPPGPSSTHQQPAGTPPGTVSFEHPAPAPPGVSPGTVRPPTTPTAPPNWTPPTPDRPGGEMGPA
jgi:hypothetical protein